MIKTVEFDKPHKKCRYDQKTRTWKGFQVDVYVLERRGGALKRKRPIYPTRNEAEKAETRLKTKSQNLRLGIYQPEDDADTAQVTLKELFARHGTGINRRAERIRAERIFEYFLSRVVEHEDLPVIDLRTAHLKAYITKRERDRVKPTTVYRELNVIASALHSAGEYFPELEAWICPKIARPKISRRGRERVITENEKRLICAELLKPKSPLETAAEAENRKRIGRMFDLAWHLGLRLGECMKLKTGDYNRQERTLRVVRWKTGDVTLFEFLPDPVLEILDEAIGAAVSEYIFTVGGNYPKDFYSILKDVCELLDIPYGRDTENGLTFHSNRHSFTSRLIQVTDAATAKSFTGHSKEEMVLYYSHASQESRRAAFEKLYGKRQVFGAGELQEIFEKVRSGEMEFAEFEARIYAKI